MSVDWAAVYRATYADLVRFLHAKVWDADRAHDLAQETFVRALDHNPDQPRAWLFTIASNLARDESRMVMRRRRHLALIRGELQAAAQAPDPVDDVERTERVARVRRALEQLTERDREVLLLKNAGLSYPEIARQTGLSPGAIGTTLARARRRLLEAYDESEGRDAARG